jgi:SnoaL-like domain
MSQWTTPQASIQVKTEENEMEQSIEKIIERNLLEVFNARDADSRRAAIDGLWDKDGVFIDPGGVHEGVEKISAIVQLLFTQFEDYVFSVRGPGQSMHGVGRLPWLYGPPDDPQRLTGTDVGVTKDGKLTALYVFIDSPSQK